MVQHMILMMVAPMFLQEPITLALRTLPTHRVRAARLALAAGSV
jgi:cytochrome c oxidase assembly factor CtaG